MKTTNNRDSGRQFECLKGGRGESGVPSLVFGVRPRDAELRTDDLVEVPLPEHEWLRVAGLAASALMTFKTLGYADAVRIKDCMTSLAAALTALDENETKPAIYHLQSAEVSLSWFGVRRAAHAVGESSVIEDGCKRAVASLKQGTAACVRGIVRSDQREFIRARIALEDAAMCILSAEGRR